MAYLLTIHYLKHYGNTVECKFNIRLETVNHTIACEECLPHLKKIVLSAMHNCKHMDCLVTVHLTPQRCYSETPLIRIPRDQFNLFELEGFRIKGD